MVKRGLGDSYNKTVIPQKLRGYLDLSKPASSIGIMLTIPFASIFYAELNGINGATFIVEQWRTILYASVTLFLVHSASQSMNMAEDAHIDAQTDHKQNRPIPSGVVSKEEARSLAWICMFLGIVRAITITPEFAIYVVVLSFFGVFYNLEPFRFKKYLWINLAWQAASRGLLLYPATFAVWGEMYNPVAWGMGVIAFLLVLCLQNTADFSDVDIDEQYGIITPAVHHGLDELVVIMGGIAVAMFLSIRSLIRVDLIPDLWSLYLLVIPISWTIWSLWNEPRSISQIGGNHFSWYVFYFSLACMYILPATQLLLF